jgi:hypothetical protein
MASVDEKYLMIGADGDRTEVPYPATIGLLDQTHRAHGWLEESNCEWTLGPVRAHATPSTSWFGPGYEQLPSPIVDPGNPLQSREIEILAKDLPPYGDRGAQLQSRELEHPV